MNDTTDLPTILDRIQTKQHTRTDYHHAQNSLLVDVLHGPNEVLINVVAP